MILRVILSAVGVLIFCLFTGAYFQKLEARPIVVSFILSILIVFLYREVPAPYVITDFMLLLMLWVLSLEDIEYLFITGWKVLVFAVIVFIARAYLRIPAGLNILSVVIAGLFFLLPYAVTKGKGIGLGDGILFCLMAVLLTPVETVVLFLITTLSALAYAAASMAVKKKVEPFPLAPFIFYATLIFLPQKLFWIGLSGLKAVYYLQWIN